jgi:hypothetical protein
MPFKHASNNAQMPGANNRGYLVVEQPGRGVNKHHVVLIGRLNDNVILD